jgi:hypothetical protein
MVTFSSLLSLLALTICRRRASGKRSFLGPHDGYQRRYTTRDAALAGHDEAAALAAGKTH